MEPEQVRDLLIRAFPGDRIQRVELAKNGWDNLVAIADDQRVFRISRRPDYPRSAERWALDNLRGKLTLAVPQIDRWSDDPPCMGYPLLPGISAPAEWLKEPSEHWIKELAVTLAGFLRQCHLAISGDQAKAAGLKGFSLSPLSFQDLLARAKGLDPESMDYAESLLRNSNDQSSNNADCFLYGDLHSGNLLFDPMTRQVSAVLDFGNVCWGELESEFYDLAGSWPTLCQAVITEYEKISGIKINKDRIRRHAVIFCLSVFAEDKLSFMRSSATKRMEKLRKGRF